MAELVLQNVGSRSGRQGAAHAARAATVAAVLAAIGRGLLRAVIWILRLGSPSLQASISGKGWTGVPGNPCAASWLGIGGPPRPSAR